MRPLLSLTLLLCLLCLALCASSSLLPHDFQRGMSYANGKYCPFVRLNEEPAKQSLRELKEQTGTTAISLIVTWFQETVNSTVIAPNRPPNGKRSPTDEETEH
eukprot:EC851372.1.p1 GENE.EC851372.1~~EC851372.1.p1  ORF type:complete len:103 (+),score=18.34 EC851372.1:47-355(+)